MVDVLDAIPFDNTRAIDDQDVFADDWPWEALVMWEDVQAFMEAARADLRSDSRLQTLWERGRWAYRRRRYRARVALARRRAQLTKKPPPGE